VIASFALVRSSISFFATLLMALVAAPLRQEQFKHTVCLVHGQVCFVMINIPFV
jgi:hypothetical protein